MTSLNDSPTVYMQGVDHQADLQKPHFPFRAADKLIRSQLDTLRLDFHPVPIKILLPWRCLKLRFVMVINGIFLHGSLLGHSHCHTHPI